MSLQIMHGMDSAELPVATPKTFMLERFWKGMVEGRFHPLKPKEIEQLLDNVHCRQMPLLTALTPEEEAFFRNAIRDIVRYGVNRQSQYDPRGIFHALCNNIIATEERNSTTEKIAAAILYCLTTSELRKANARRQFEGSKLRPLSMNEKIAYFNRPEVWENGRCRMHNEDAKKVDGGWYGVQYREENLNLWGYRGLDEYMTRETFERLVKETKKRTGKTQLSILDIGGGMGKALKEARTRHPELKCINLTMTEEPAMYEDEGVRHLYGSAERMPASMKGKCDIIISNMALRYMYLHDVGYFNIVDALSVGGEACVAVETNWQKEGLPIHVLVARVRRAFEVLNHLKNIEAIEFMCYGMQSFNSEDARVFDPTYERFCPYGMIRIVKKQDIDLSQYERITKVS